MKMFKNASYGCNEDDIKMTMIDPDKDEYE